jgi:hypothetical protein
METKLVALLSAVNHNQDTGWCYLTAYQLAIAFAAAYPAETAALGLPIGGAGTGQYNSLSQYIGGQLAQRIRDGRITQIELAFLSKNSIAELRFRTGDGQDVVSSLTDAWDVSLYRLAE